MWCDTYGTERQKSFWMTVILLASPLGVVLGYTLTYYMNKYATWEWSFIVQAFALLPCTLCLHLTPARYFNIEQTIEFRQSLDKTVNFKGFYKDK